jgi:hypothetical protein
MTQAVHIIIAYILTDMTMTLFLRDYLYPRETIEDMDFLGVHTIIPKIMLYCMMIYALS